MPTALRSIRSEQGFSIRTLADAVGVSPMTVFYWENGKTQAPRNKGKHQHQQRLEAILGVPITVLLSEERETPAVAGASRVGQDSTIHQTEDRVYSE